MTQGIVTFAGQAYFGLDRVDRKHAMGAQNLEDMDSPQLLALYNLVSSNLGRGRVKRFADTKTAVRRTWKILQEYDAQVKEEKQAHLARQFSSLPEDIRKDVTSGALPLEAAVAEWERKQAEAPAAFDPGNSDNTPLPQAKSEALLQAIAAARKEPSPKRELWRRPKHEAPARTAYQPRPNTLQATMYDLLVTPGGILVEDFCAAVKATGTRDKTLFTPPNVWAAMRYLYCANRGYGLDFDGQRIALIVPKDERSAERKG